MDLVVGVVINKKNARIDTITQKELSIQELCNSTRKEYQLKNFYLLCCENSSASNPSKCYPKKELLQNEAN